MHNHVLNSQNVPFVVTGFFTDSNASVLGGLPLGTAGDSPTGTLAVKTIPVSGGPVAGFNIPPHDSQTYTYYGSTNNVQTVEYKMGEDTVFTLYFAYAASGAADNDRVTYVGTSEPA